MTSHISDHPLQLIISVRFTERSFFSILATREDFLGLFVRINIYIYYCNKPVEKLYEPTTSCNELLLGARYFT